MGGGVALNARAAIVGATGDGPTGIITSAYTWQSSCHHWIETFVSRFYYFCSPTATSTACGSDASSAWLTSFAKGLYFLDGADQRGVTYELVKMFEEEINEKLDTGLLRISVLIIPVTRDRLIPALVEGYGDIAAANLTITPERRELVEFADPLVTGVDELVVTGPTAPELGSLDDLGGREIYVRPSSSYYESLVRLNEMFRAEGKPEVVLTPADEYLEDEDLLEMVSAGLLPMVVVDSTKAEFWSQIFEDLEPRPALRPSFALLYPSMSRPMGCPPTSSNQGRQFSDPSLNRAYRLCSRTRSRQIRRT